MPSLVLNPLQKRLYSILNADAIIGGLINGIFDNAPDDTPEPYLEIGDDSMGDFGGHTFTGFEGTVTIHIWTKGEGRKDNKEIQDRLYDLLHEIDLQIPGFNTVCFRCILSETLVEPEDNRTYHGVQRYNLTVTEE